MLEQEWGYRVTPQPRPWRVLQPDFTWMGPGQIPWSQLAGRCPKAGDFVRGEHPSLFSGSLP